MADCPICQNLEAKVFDKNQYCDSLTEQQERMFREHKGGAGDLDSAVEKAKYEANAAMQELDAHKSSPH